MNTSIALSIIVNGSVFLNDNFKYIINPPTNVH